MNTKQQYSISYWPDTEELQKRLYHLANELPIHQIKRDKMDEYLKHFDTKCAGSKKMTDRAKELIPGGVQHNLAFNYPFPLAITKADGAYLWDVDGNRYLDFLQAGGPTLLGSNYRPVQEKVIEVIRESGPVTGLFHEYELKLAELIHQHVPSVEMFRMLMSGTEADMAAVRAARCFTGKKYIIKNGGAYHGWSDQFVFGMRVPGVGPLDAHGIPAGCYQFTKEVFPNDIDALQKRMEENEKDGGTAAVFVEPLGPESGTRPVLRDYNKNLRELCDRFGALLVFDEVVTGFRVGLGGAQGYFNVKPDLTVFGKCVAGGYPGAGGVGGRKDVMSCYAAGLAGGPGGKRAFVGGTLSANPLSLRRRVLSPSRRSRRPALTSRRARPATGSRRGSLIYSSGTSSPSWPSTTARSATWRPARPCSWTSRTPISSRKWGPGRRSWRRWARRSRRRGSSPSPAAGSTAAWRTRTM